jgi:lysophospholipase L1-like esterase
MTSFPTLMLSLTLAVGLTTVAEAQTPPLLAPVAAPTPPAAIAPAMSIFAKAAEEKLHTDWADLGHYRAENAALPPPDVAVPRVVFMGDSITEFWKVRDPAFFAHPGYVDRGISGQTTPQMLVRFRADVIALRPTVVHIMGGTNDVAGNTGPESLETIENNLISMVDLARADHIRVILASVPPAADFWWKRGQQPAPRIAALNAWMQAYADREHLVYADYYAALNDGAGGMRADYSKDGVHPNPAGYAVMDALANAAIRQALR